MRLFRVFLLGFFVVALGLAKADEFLSPQAFSERFSQRLREALPQAGVEIVAPLHLRISLRKSGDSTVYLADAFEVYKQEPDSGEDLIARYVAGAIESMQMPSKIEASKIVPVLKTRKWLDEVTKGSASEQPVVYDVVNEELVIVYAEDTGKSLGYFSTQEFTDSEIERSGLRHLAASNLVRILPKIERHGGDGFYTIQAGGDFEASLLVTGTVWTQKSFPVKGDHVFSVPARDKIFVTGSKDVEGLKKIRELAERVYRESSHRLSSKLFVLRDNAVSILPE